VFTSNVRGIVKNWDSFLQVNLDKYDILLLNEIWQIKEFENINLENYELATIKQRTNQKGGGSLIYIKKNIKYKTIESPFEENLLETSAIIVDNTVFCSLYRPPSGNKNESIDKLIDWIESIRNSNLVIAGDWNLNNLNNDKTHLEKIEQLTNLKRKIKSITRLASGTCIDNVLTNLEGKFIVSNICIADHQAIVMELNVKSTKISNKKFVYREMKEHNWLVFSNEVKKLSLPDGSIDEKWNSLTKTIREMIEKSFPEKERKSEYTFHMSQGLLKSKHKKNKLYKKFKSGQIPKDEYIKYNKIYKKLIFKSKEDNFREKMTDAGHDSKKKWKILKKELKIHQTNEEITEINHNNETYTDRREISACFKTHFENCAKKLAENLPESNELEILIDDQPELVFTETTVVEIEKIINSLLPKNSCGFDLLSNRMIKKEKKQFSKILSPLINESLNQGIFPEALKSAKVVPIFKKGDKTNMNNYRPISLLPVISKVFEKVLNNRINQHLNENNLIDDNQYGFRPEHSTEDAIVKFVDHIEKELTKRKHVVSIFVDVSKAFDSCDHQILIKKLEKIGLRGKNLDIMKSYLLDRKQEVFIGNISGGSFKINIGVGQGTILGPTLFKIYIMDMYKSTNLFSLRFADDTSLIGSGDNPEATEEFINTELEKVYKWFCSNKLTLHPDKSRCIIHTKEKAIQIKLGNKNIMRCGYNLQEEGVKLLGITIDENLDWRLQTKAVMKKISKGNYLLWRYRKQLTPKMKKTIYESFVRCHLNYCNIVWGAKKSNNLTELNKTLKRIWKKIGTYNQHTNTRLLEHNIMKFNDEVALSEAKFIWRWNKKKLPNGITSIITEKTERSLRGRKFLREPKWKMDSIASRLAIRANNEINFLDKFNTKTTFKKHYKEKLKESYKIACRIRNCTLCIRMPNTRTH